MASNLNETTYDFLSGTSHKIDVLALAEASGEGNWIHKQCWDTASKSTKAENAIYANKNFDMIERTDLNMNNKRSKNIIIYRHPHNNFKDFFQYLERLLECSCSRKQWITYIYCDFNFDLLKIDSDHVTLHFFNLQLCVYGLLPHVLQPTRVTRVIIQLQSLTISVVIIFRKIVFLQIYY